MGRVLEVEMPVEYRILGPLQVLVDGDYVPLGEQKPRKNLLIYLLVHRNRPMSRDEIIDAVYGESDGDHVGALQRLVANLRKQLRPGQTQVLPPAEGNCYTLRVDPGQLDAERFEGLLSQAERDLRKDEPDARTAYRQVNRALKLWPGEHGPPPAQPPRPLVDVYYEDWARPEIDRLEGRYVDAQELRARTQVYLGHYSEVVQGLPALVEAHPTRQTLTACLMVGYFYLNRQQDARSAYQALTDALAEFRDEPSRELNELDQSIRVGRLPRHWARDVGEVPESPDLALRDTARSLLRLARTYARLQAWETALDFCDRSLKAFNDCRDVDSLGIAEVLTEQGEMLFKSGQRRMALEQHAQSLEVCEAIGAKYLSASVYERMAGIDDRLGDEKLAQGHWKAAFLIYQELGDAR